MPKDMPPELKEHLEQASVLYIEIATIGKDLFLRWLRGDPWSDLHSDALRWADLYNSSERFTNGQFCCVYCPAPDAPAEAVRPFMDCLRVNTGVADARPTTGLVGGRVAYMTLCEYPSSPRVLEPDILDIEARHGIHFSEPIDIAHVARLVDQWEAGSGLDTLRQFIEQNASSLLEQSPTEKMPNTTRWSGPPPRGWQNVKLTFPYSDASDGVTVSLGAITRWVPRTDFQGVGRKKATDAWDYLRLLSETGLSVVPVTGSANERTRQRQHLTVWRHALKTYFGLSDDPLPPIRGESKYRILFSLTQADTSKAVQGF